MIKKLNKKTCDFQAFLLTRKKSAIGATALSIFMTPLAANATSNTGDAIQNGISEGAKSIWTILVAIVLPIAAVFFAWAAFKAIFGGEHGMEAAKKTFITIVIVIALVLLAPLVVSQVGGWFSGSSSNAWQW